MSLTYNETMKQFIQENNQNRDKEKKTKFEYLTVIQALIKLKYDL